MDKKYSMHLTFQIYADFLKNIVYEDCWCRLQTTVLFNLSFTYISFCRL
uniref:Uncharacterized protein n=1 Tax=Anguilla anguilla TaxID=7936 RepID=A0A0E9PEP9_ANGAN